METNTTTQFLPTIAVEYQETSHDWLITASAPLTDEQAQALTFRADPSQVRLGGFVEVSDPEGSRIGHVSTAVYRERLDGPAYVVCTINLR